MDSQSDDININQSEEISTQCESVVLHTETTSTGRKIHYASHGILFYNRRDVLKSGRLYFVCSEKLCNADSNVTKGENAKNMKDVQCQVQIYAQCQVQRSGKNCTVSRSGKVEKLTPSNNLPSFLCHRVEFEFGAVPK